MFAVLLLFFSFIMRKLLRQKLSAYLDLMHSMSTKKKRSESLEGIRISRQSSILRHPLSVLQMRAHYVRITNCSCCCCLVKKEVMMIWTPRCLWCIQLDTCNRDNGRNEIPFVSRVVCFKNKNNGWRAQSHGALFQSSFCDLSKLLDLSLYPI